MPVHPSVIHKGPFAVQDDEERERALDALEKALRPATLAERERCPTCGNWLDDHGAKWCACPTCKKPFEPAHGCKPGHYGPDDIPF